MLGGEEWETKAWRSGGVKEWESIKKESARNPSEAPHGWSKLPQWVSSFLTSYLLEPSTEKNWNDYEMLVCIKIVMLRLGGILNR
jgi:hypothetical protein